MPISKQRILEDLHSQLKGRKLYNKIAKEYGCTAGYLGNVLKGRASYNQKLIDIATSILEKDKQNEAYALRRTAKKLGVR